MASKRFRRKPVVVEAMQVAPPYKTVIDWCGATKIMDGNTVKWLLVPTWKGDMRADLGDWIIKDAHSGFYPCKPHVFEAAYEEALDE